MPQTARQHGPSSIAIRAPTPHRIIRSGPTRTGTPQIITTHRDSFLWMCC